MIETHKIMSGREGVKREDLFQAAMERGDPNLVRGKKFLRRDRMGRYDKTLFRRGW